MNRDDALRLLRGGEEGIEEWNLRRRRGDSVPSLREANLVGVHFGVAPPYDLDVPERVLRKLVPGPDLSDVDLRGGNLSNANLCRADLSRADLSMAHLVGTDLFAARLIRTNLSQANLAEAKLNDADLTEAVLNKASLDWADLVGARLLHANLTDASLGESNLTGAYLTGANLRGVNLRGANLTEVRLASASLSEAHLHETILANVDLSEAEGLDTCHHSGPSTIDHRTLQRSGPLPLVFLRGCGLPDLFIENIPALFHGDAIQFYSCFISYSSKDHEFAERLHADLQDKRVRCWFAPEDMRIGEKILDTVDREIRLRDKILLVLSAAAIESDWVEDEVTAGFEEERRRQTTVLFPVRLDDGVMDCTEAWAAKLRSRHIGDFREWKQHDAYKRALDRLLRDLKVQPGSSTP